MFRLFSGLRIRARLSAAFLLVAVLGGAIGAFGVWGMAHINAMNSELYDVELRGLSEMREANIQLVYAGRARNSYLAASTERERQAVRKQFDDAVQALDRLRERADGYYHTPRGRQLLSRFKQQKTPGSVTPRPSSPPPAPCRRYRRTRAPPRSSNT